jgi:hypothetical protein
MLVTVAGKQGKSVIEPASYVVDFYFFDTLLDILHGLQDIPRAVLLHVVLWQIAMSDPASDTQWSDMHATMATIVFVVRLTFLPSIMFCGVMQCSAQATWQRI